MSDKIQKAFDNLRDAITEEATEGLNQIKASVVPVLGQIIAQATTIALKGAFKFEDLFEDANTSAKSNDGGGFAADPLPTEEQNSAIKALRTLGKNDEEIANIVGVSVRTVKMAV